MPEEDESFIQLRIHELADGMQTSLHDVKITREEALRILPGRREVFAGHWGDTKVVSKCYLPNKKMERDWKREWRSLIQLQKLGLPAPRPLFTGQDPTTGSLWVVMLYIEGARPLKALLPTLAEDRVEVMAKLATVLEKMHQAGARQVDQHIANWAYNGESIYLLDAGTVQFQNRALSARQAMDDLATLSATLDLPSLDAFRRALGQPGANEQFNAVIVDKLRKRLKRHYKKTRRNCTEYGRNDSGQHQGIYSKLANSKLVESFFKDPEAYMTLGERLKSGNTCTVQSFDYEGKTYVLKRYNMKSLGTRLRKALKESRAIKSWSNAWCLLTAHIPTSRPVAVYEERKSLLPGRSYLLMEQIPGESLIDYVTNLKNPEQLEATIQSVANIWRALELIRSVHRDLKASNLIVEPSGRAAIFDLDAMGICLSDQAFMRGRRKDFKRFIHNWAQYPELEQRFRQTLLGASDLGSPLRS